MRSLGKAPFVRTVLSCLMAVAVLLGLNVQQQPTSNAVNTAQSQSVASAQVSLTEVNTMTVASSKMSVSTYKKQSSYPFWKSSKAQANWNADPLGFYKRSCVSYVAYKVLHINGVNMRMPAGKGSASYWKSWASSHGYKVTTTPQKNSVAWWGNHVGWVKNVSASKKTIETWESNWGNDYSFHSRSITKGKGNWPKYFLIVKK